MLFINNLYFIFFYFILFYLILFLCFVYNCNVATIFCFNFNIIFNFTFHYFLLLIFYTYSILFIFVSCCWLQCKHQYFVYFNSISFTYFPISIFLFNNSVSFHFCVVSTIAMWTLMPIFCFNSFLIHFPLLHFLIIYTQ